MRVLLPSAKIKLCTTLSRVARPRHRCVFHIPWAKISSQSTHCDCVAQVCTIQHGPSYVTRGAEHLDNRNHVAGLTHIPKANLRLTPYVPPRFASQRYWPDVTQKLCVYATWLIDTYTAREICSRPIFWKHRADLIQELYITVISITR